MSTDLDALLAQSLRAAGGAFTPANRAEARRRFVRRLRRRRLVHTAEAVALAGAAALAGLFVARTASVQREGLPPSAGLAVTQTYAVGADPRGLAVADGRVWVANHADGTLTRVDVRSGRTADLDFLPGGEPRPGTVVESQGFLFVTDAASATVVPVDPASGSAVTQLNVGPDPGDVVSTGRPLWAASADPAGGAVYLDAPTSDAEGSDAPELKAVATFAARPELAAWGEIVWASAAGRVTSLRLLDSGKVDRAPAIEVPGARDVAADAGGIWVVTDSRSIVRIDPATRRIVAEADLGLAPGGRVAVDRAAVWVVAGSDGAGQLVRVDPRSLRVVGRLALEGGPFHIATGAGAVWVTDESGNSLYRIERRD
jgi:streptogramin lyase